MEWSGVGWGTRLAFCAIGGEVRSLVFVLYCPRVVGGCGWAIFAFSAAREEVSVSASRWLYVSEMGLSSRW